MPAIYIPRLRAFDANGDPISGAKAYFYTAGTSTPATVYSNDALSVPHPSPLVADSEGRFAQIFVAQGDYKAVIKDASDVTLETIDYVEAAELSDVTSIGDPLYARLASPNTFSSTNSFTGQTSYTKPLSVAHTGTQYLHTMYRTDGYSALAGLQYQTFTGSPGSVIVVGLDNAGASVGTIARYDLGGTSMPSVATIATREKGDARWAAISSERFKKDIGKGKKLEKPGTTKEVLAALEPKPWVWDIDKGDERHGRKGFGLIAEEVETVFPEGVSYQWVPDAEGNDTTERRILGLDTAAIIGFLWDAHKEQQAEIDELRARIEALEK